MTNENKIAVYFYGAFTPESDGSHARMCSLLNRLSITFQNVVLYSYENHPQCPWTPDRLEAFRARWPSVELVLEPYTAKLKMLTRVKNLLISTFPRSADRILRFSVRGWSPQFDRVKSQVSAIFVSYTAGMAQLNGVNPEMCHVDTHDINFAKWANMSGSSSVSVASLRKLRGEIAALQTAGTVVAISPSEAAFFRMMLRGSKVVYVASWDALQNQSAESASAEKDIDLVFFGSHYVMNVRGVCEMLETHGHWLSRYRIAICGNVCGDPEVIAAAKRFPNVTLMGYIEHPDSIYARSKAALSPVDGTGLKMKIVAAIRAGLPIFASKQAIDGLPPGSENAVFPITEANVTRILDNEQHLTAAREAARIYYGMFDQGGEVTSLLGELRASTTQKTSSLEALPSATA